MRNVGKSAGLREAALSAGLLLSLCGCSSSGSGNDTFADKMASAAFGTPAPETKVVTEKSPEFDCPAVEVRAGASTLSVTAKVAKGVASASGDPGALDLRYQSNIVRTARECHVANGNVTMKVGVEGRVLLGPAGGPGQLDIPLRLAVVREGPEPKTIASRLYHIPVAINVSEGHVNFSQIADDIAFPLPARLADIDAYVVYIGFDPQGAIEPKPKGKPKPRSAPKPMARQNQQQS